MVSAQAGEPDAQNPQGSLVAHALRYRVVGALLLLGMLCSLAVVGAVVSRLGLYAIVLPSYRVWRSIVLRGPFKRASKRLSLRYETRGLLLEGALSGVHEGHNVTVNSASRSFRWGPERLAGRTRFCLDARDVLPRSLRVRPRDRSCGADEDWVETRDPQFDGRLCACGDAASVLARLNSQARLRLISMSPELTIEDGLVVYETSHLLREARAIEHLLFEMSSLVELLSISAEEEPRQLLNNALHDPLAQVRYRNLEVLLARHHGSELAQRAIEAYLKAPDPEGSLIAALHAGPRGIAKVKAAARWPQHILRVKALEHLGRRLLGTEARPYFEEALLQGPETVRAAAAREITSLGWRELAPVMEEAFERAGALSTVVIAQGLFELERELARPLIVRMLRHDSDEVVITAAKLMARDASAMYLAPLKIAADRGRRAKVARALRRALTAVREGCPHPERGGLSLTASVQTGALAVTEEGALSKIGKA